MAIQTGGTLMHNSTFKSPGKGLTRRTGLTRTAFKAKPDAKPLRSKALIAKQAENPSLRNCTKSQTHGTKPRSTLKTHRTETSKIRQSARNEDCTLRLPGVCKVELGNVVWAHSNRSADGKGGGLKADDEAGAYACYWCHCVYDRQHKRPVGMTLEFVETEFTRAMRESRAILVRKGLVRPFNKPVQMLLQDIAESVNIYVAANARLAIHTDNPHF